MNKIFLIGRLTKDIEVRFTQNEKKIGNFTLAVNREYKNADGEYETDFINCLLFTNVDTVEKYTKKGDLISVMGRLQNRSYEDKEGKKDGGGFVIRCLQGGFADAETADAVVHIRVGRCRVVIHQLLRIQSVHDAFRTVTGHAGFHAARGHYFEMQVGQVLPVCGADAAYFGASGYQSPGGDAGVFQMGVKGLDDAGITGDAVRQHHHVAPVRRGFAAVDNQPAGSGAHGVALIGVLPADAVEVLPAVVAPALRIGAAEGLGVIGHRAVIGSDGRFKTIDERNLDNLLRSQLDEPDDEPVGHGGKRCVLIVNALRSLVRGFRDAGVLPDNIADNGDKPGDQKSQEKPFNRTDANLTRHCAGIIPA